MRYPETTARAQPSALSNLGLMALLFCCALGYPAPTLAQTCVKPGGCTGDVPAGMCGISKDPIETGVGCDGLNNCQNPEFVGDLIFEVAPQLFTNVFDVPRFTVRMAFKVKSPWNTWARQENPNGQLQGLWVDPGGRVSVCHSNLADESKIWVAKTLTCADMWNLRGGEDNPGAPRYTLTVASCGPPCDPADPGCFTSGCHRWAQKKDIVFSIPDDKLAEYCPRKGCPEGTCCPAGPGGSGPPGGGLGGGGGWGSGGPGPGGPPPGSSVAAGGPVKAASNSALGRYWSHAFAERIIPRPEGNHVWLYTANAVYQEFWDIDGDGTYDKASPSHVRSTLTDTGSGWELRALDGTVKEFNADGQWTATRDRNGNTTSGTYSGGVLQSVDTPDRRRFDYTYHADGLLASITEVGVGGTLTRTWGYAWSGEDLARIDRPDGTAWLLRYDDPANPGYVTRRTLRGTDGSERIDAAREYDQFGNLARKWRGDVSPTGPRATEVFSYSYTRPWNPIERTETDPLNNLTTITYQRDPGSNIPLVTSSSGDCSSCGTGPNSQQLYDDPSNPMKVTRSIDARGTVTLLEYDGNGQLISRTEAMGTDLERTTTWEYDKTYPSLVTAREQPSTSGSGVRRTAWTYDPAGNATIRTEEGVENGSAFSYQTVTSYNGAGQPVSIDPPGHGTQDQTLFSYDASRGNLLVATRTDPLIGATSFDHDPFNRRTSVTDVNGVVTATSYDDLDRVTSVIQKGASTAEDLATAHVYYELGDLLRTTLPEGNVIEYGYSSAGHLVSIERKPDEVNHGDRTFYTLNSLGQRIREELQGWSGSGWQTESFTDSVYTSRCNLDKVVYADGSVTEYAYDCQGNLEQEWDANHPSNGQQNPASKDYTYDELDRLTTITQPWGGAGGGTIAIRYEYDVQDHLVRVVDGNGTVTIYTYGDRDLLTEEVSEVSGTTSSAYDEAGDLVRETDARGVSVERTIDAAGRPVFVDYPETSLDTLYTYDDPAVPFSKSRLTGIMKDGRSVDYRYDRFGRLVQDGALTYGYDGNGNRTTIGYPGGVSAFYTFDFADRQASLDLDDGSGSSRALVSAARYLPSGPLSSLTLGNGLTETRAFTSRYFPSRIMVPGRLNWVYSTDTVGNITGIADALDAAQSRTYGYQAHQYYLTLGNGPWGDFTWTYDRLGNRLSETRDGALSAYGYLPNAAGNRSPQLQTVTDSEEKVTRYFYDATGSLTHENRESEKVRYSYNAAQRLSQIRVDEANRTPSSTDLRYDGRSFLERSIWTPSLGLPVKQWKTQSTYGSNGLLHHRAVERYPTAQSPRLTPSVTGDDQVFYFAERPVAIFATRTSTLLGDTPTTTSEISYLTSDHLGTPVLATGEAGDLLWTGGFGPFGEDFASAQDAGVFLRFRGQWANEGFSLGDRLFYNLHRWYQPKTGTYTRPDPMLSERRTYRYAGGNPLRLVDPLGLVKMTGFSGLMGAQTVAAVALVTSKLNSNPCCADVVRKGSAQKMLSYLIAGPPNELEIEFVALLRPSRKRPRGLCGWSTARTMLGLSKKIQIAPLAATCCSNSVPKIVSIAAVILHELGHSTMKMRGEKKPDALMKGCFGCNN